MRFSDNRQVECTLRGIAQYPDHMDRTRREESVRRFPASQRARRAPRRPAADTSAVESAVVMAPTIENRPTPSASLRHTVGARNGAPRFAEAAGSRRALSSAVGCRRLPGRLVFSAAEHEVGPPPPRSGFGEISPKRRRHTLCAKAELFGAGAHRGPLCAVRMLRIREPNIARAPGGVAAVSDAQDGPFRPASATSSRRSRAACAERSENPGAGRGSDTCGASRRSAWRPRRAC